MLFRRYFAQFSSAISLLALSCGAYAQTGATARPEPLITRPASDAKLVSLKGNTRSSANSANDRGTVAKDLLMEHLLLQLKRPPEAEQALDQLIGEMYDPASPHYHQWLTATQLGQQFGLAQEDLNTITAWLESKGMTVNAIYPNGLLIDFSGTAAQVSAAFHTSIHSLNVNGAEHIANMTDPQIPEALAPAVAGVVSMSDFMPHAMSRPRANYTYTSGGVTYQAIVPADLATIYNLNPLFAAGISGQQQTIVVIEDSDVYAAADWNTFRSVFGLSGYQGGSFAQIHPGNTCKDPGVVAGDDGEAIVDAEWASAAAPSAAIQVASCANTRTTFGGLIALNNLLSASSPPAIISISYGECEAENGAAANAALNHAYKQAVAEGVAVFVAAGDEGAASCDAGATAATHGIGVSAFASTPYNVAVGGTDFGDTVDGANSQYWSATNNSIYESALSYVPEIPWNDSCASQILSTYFGYSTPYNSNGSPGFCNTSLGEQNFLTVTAGSGGPSGCAFGAPSIRGVVSGSCRGYDKPAWQSGFAGNPSDGVRDIPDVSLFAGNGVWGHYYVFCWSDLQNGGAPCTGAPSSWAGGGGTSFSAPILAGIQALVNQKAGSDQGYPNPTYYALGAGYSGSPACASTAAGVSSNCIFYDVVNGDNDVNCTGTNNCYDPSLPSSGRRRRQAASNGVLSISDSSYQPAYSANSSSNGLAWDFATGIGSVNAYNLVCNWPGVSCAQ